MNSSRNVLLAGTGPVAVQFAVMLKRYWNCRVGIAGRHSLRSASFYEALEQSNGKICVQAQSAQHQMLEGEYLIDNWYQSYASVEGQWDTIILTVTADAYVQVLEKLPPQCLFHAACIVLISPTFGSNALITQYLQERDCKAEVISFSTYLGDTRHLHNAAPNHVLITAVKRKVFIGSSLLSSQSIEPFSLLYKKIGINLETMSTPLEAETRNISLYVHPPLFMNDFSLHVIFKQISIPKFVYKLFPEGPITPVLIAEMLEQWKEITEIIKKLRGKPVNLLQFMIDDNYPIRPESLSRHDINDFPQLEPVMQQYALYVRYASLLIDPFSEPDQYGKYFDFSAVPIRQIFINYEGDWDIPRMPKEDYYRIKIIQGIARAVNVPCPTIDTFIERYEHSLTVTIQSLKDESLSEAFKVQSFESDVRRISKQLLNIHSIKSR